MGRILMAAQQLPPTPTNPLRAETFRMGLILLFCCGLRRGELQRLRLGDIEDEQTVLRIRLTKFYKSRLVPLSPTVTLELRHYLQKRGRQKLPMGPEAFLMWSGHGGSEVYGTTNLATVWRLTACAWSNWTLPGSTRSCAAWRPLGAIASAHATCV